MMDVVTVWVTGNGWSLSVFLLGQCMWDELWMDLATALWIAMLWNRIGIDPIAAMAGM